MNANPKQDLKKAYSIAAIIGIFMIASVFALLAIVQLMVHYEPLKSLPRVADLETIRYILYAAGLIDFFLISFVNKAILAKKLSVSNEPQPNDIFTPEIQLQITASIISYALCEAIALYGFILFIFSRETVDFYPFWLGSLISFAAYFPRYKQWQLQDKRGNRGI